MVIEGLLRGLIYPIQFDEDPLNGVERALKHVVHAGALGARPEDYLAAIEAGLGSDMCISGLIPQQHSEATIRSFLHALQERLQR